jgi:hypothetical protein
MTHGSDPTAIADLIGPVLKDLVHRSNTDLRRWLDQVNGLRGCGEPVRPAGETMTLDANTGHVLSHYSTANEPHGQLMVRCKNRRATRCPSCADEYRADAYHFIKAGLASGERTSRTVSAYRCSSRRVRSCDAASRSARTSPRITSGRRASACTLCRGLFDDVGLAGELQCVAGRLSRSG